MRWPPWGSNSQDPATNDKQEQQQRQWWPTSSSEEPPRNWNKALNATDWAAFTEARTLIPTLVLTGSILAAVRIRRRLRRFPDATSISSSFFRQRSIFGEVTSVGDGDNFRLYHTPGGRFTGWGWLPWKKVPTSRKDLKDKTVCWTYNVHFPCGYRFTVLTMGADLGTCSSGRDRRPRTRTFWSPGAALRPRLPQLANLISPPPSCARLPPPPRPVPARGSQRIRATSV